MKISDKQLSIFQDEKYRICLSLAALSGGRTERYGSILVKNNRIYGIGRSREIAGPKIKLERIIKQGFANHAEIESMNDALYKDYNIKNGDIYVAGYFPKNGRIFFHREYTCRICPPFMSKYEICNLYIPTPNFWIKKTLEEATKEGERFVSGAHEKRLASCIGNYIIDTLKYRLMGVNILQNLKN